MTKRTILGDDLTSAALVALMRLSFSADRLDLDHLRGPHTVATSGPHASLSDKNALADQVLAKHGAAPLLRVGTQVTVMASDPIGVALLAARDGPDVISRWQRLERYLHMRHPIRASRISATSADLTHSRAVDHDHSPAMDLVLAGVIAGLLAAVGCADVTLEFGRGATRTTAIDRGRIRPKGALPPKLATDHWHFIWATLSRPPAVPFETKSVPHRSHLAREIKALFQRDLLNLWSLTNIAHHLGLSTRTLQRRLADEGHTLQGLRRTAQLDHATHLMLTTEHTLTTIGYACGFSDSAHFTRTFKAAVGMPPAAYRAATHGPATL